MATPQQVQALKNKAAALDTNRPLAAHLVLHESRAKGGVKMRAGRLFPFLAIFILLSDLPSSHAGEIRTIRDFENSAFSKKYQAKKSDSWALKSGGMNFSYAYADSESSESVSNCGVELSADRNNVTHYGVQWHGESTLKPARLTVKREEFLRDLLSSISEKIHKDAVIAYVKKNQATRYPGGMNTAPQEKIGNILVRSGVVGPSLIVVLDIRG